MRKIIIVLLTFTLLIIGLNISIFADDYTAKKDSVLSTDEQKVTTTIEFKGPTSTPKVLFFLGTGCETHGLSFPVIDDAMNSLLAKADVDLIQAADLCYTYDGSYKVDGVSSIYHKTSWNKGQVFSNVDNSSYEIKHGFHTLTKNGVKKLYDAISTNDYNFVVICYDGFFGGYFYHGSYSPVATEGYYHSYNSTGTTELYWKDSEISSEDRAVLKDTAELLKDMNVVHLVPKQSEDLYIFGDTKMLNISDFDCGNLQYNGLTNYFDPSYKDSEFVLDTYGGTSSPRPRTEADQYYAARGMADLLAIIAPNAWLDLVDENGAYTVDELPALNKIGFDKMDINDYKDSTAVANNIDNLFNGEKVCIKDVVADDLVIDNLTITLEKYDSVDSKWVKMTSGEYDMSIDNQSITATVNYPVGTYYNGEMYRLTIVSKVTEEFGDDGKLTDTNNGDAKAQVINNNGEPFINESLKSPQVKKTMLNVTFKDGDHGKIDGYYSKVYWVYTSGVNKVKENSARAYDGYAFKGFKCSSNVIAGGKTITAGTLIKASELKDILVDKNLEFTAIYSAVPSSDRYLAPNTCVK